MKKAQFNKASSGNGAITLPFPVVSCWCVVPEQQRSVTLRTAK
jgi:hypothetical protein